MKKLQILATGCPKSAPHRLVELRKVAEKVKEPKRDVEKPAYDNDND